LGNIKICKNIYRDNIFMVNIKIGEIRLGISDLGNFKVGKIYWENCATIDL